MKLLILIINLIRLIKFGLNQKDLESKIINSDGELLFYLPPDKNLSITTKGKGKLNFIRLKDVLNQDILSSSLVNERYMNFLSHAYGSISPTLRNLKHNLTVVRNRFAALNTGLDDLERRVQQLNVKLSRDLDITLTNSCKNQLCNNGGICIPFYDGTFQCKCLDNWEGPTCEHDLDECEIFQDSDLGCQNNSTCINLPGTFQCNCVNGYSGLHCTQLGTVCTLSVPGELCGHGTCVPAANHHGFSCICEQGWQTDKKGPACIEDINECNSVKNRCHSDCINLPGSFRCGPCPLGYSGNGLKCSDIDECAIENGGCSTTPTVNCINTAGSYYCGSCPPGWYGDGRLCMTATTTNDCPSNNFCHVKAMCKVISNVQICTCIDGWTGNGYGIEGCQNIEENCSLVCKNNGTCERLNETIQCICPAGYDSKTNCETIFDVCEQHNCPLNSICSDSNDKAICKCKPGYKGESCEIVTFEAGCESIILQQEFGTLDISINERAICKWKIKIPKYEIEFKLLELNVNNDNNISSCNNFGLTIKDLLANEVIANFCTQLNTSILLTSTRNAEIIFKVNEQTKKNHRFKLEWKPTIPKCGGTFSIDVGKSGSIVSLGFLNQTPPDQKCNWFFNTAMGTIFEFQFFEMDLGNSVLQCNNYVEIIDTTGDILRKMCSSGEYQKLKSEGNQILVKFRSANYNSKFEIHYQTLKANCGGLYTSQSGIIELNQNTEWDDSNRVIACRYLIEQPEGYSIKLEIQFINVYKTKECIRNALEFYDGETEMDPILGRYCRINYNLSSSGNKILIKYVGSKYGPLVGGKIFRLKYSVNCDQTFRQRNGIIKSPKFLFSGLDCVYDIYAPMKSVIVIKIIKLILFSTNDKDCNFAVDNLEVQIDSFMSQNSIFFCTTPNSEIITKQNHLRIIFHTTNNAIMDLKKVYEFKIVYNYNTEALVCGGVFMESQGSISSYDFENIINYEQIPCKWVIAGHPNAYVEINFNNLKMDEKCENFIEIFENATIENTKTGFRYCNSIPMEPHVYQSNIVTLILHTGKNYSSNYGFTAKYRIIESRTECGGTYTSSYGVIKSPNYPNNYPKNEICTWVLNAPLGHQIELVVRNFSISSLQDCELDDHLIIRNGMTSKSPLIGQFCGKKIPKRIPSFTNHLFIRFVSGGSRPNTGFFINWIQTSTGCGGVMNSYQGSIHSPHYPEIFNGAAQCEWTIEISQGSVISFEVKTSLTNNFCLKNQLFIFDGPNSKFETFQINCNEQTNTLKGISTNNIIIIRYLTNADDDRSNFLLEYNTVCKRNFSDIHYGIIESPNFPDKYPNYLKCVWTIHGRPNNKISIFISQLQLEQISQDFLYLYEIENNISIKNTTLHSDLGNEHSFQSNADKIIIKFLTGGFGRDLGFRLEFKIIGCGEHLKNVSGIIESPNSPFSVNQYCVWKIESNYGSIIEFYLGELQIAQTSSNCTDEGLFILDEQKNIVKQFCHSESYNVIDFTEIIIYVLFKTNTNYHKKYLKASYRIKESVCGGNIWVENEFTLTSPNYPDNYPANIECLWKIADLFSNQLELTILTFELESTLNCTADYLEIKEIDSGRDHPDRFCGNNITMIEPILSKEKKLILKFVTNNVTEMSGWKLVIKPKCGSRINQSPFGYLYGDKDQDCIWFITNSASEIHIHIGFKSLQCTCAGLTQDECKKYRGIMIFDGDSIDSPFKYHICEGIHPFDIISNGGSLTVRARNASYLLTYHSLENYCSGELNAYGGELASPLYPATYPLNRECIWNAFLPEGNTIELIIKFIDIVESEHCNNDYLQVQTFNDKKILGVFCGKETPKPIRNLQDIEIIFKSSNSSSTGKGFLAECRIAHNNEIEEIDNENQGKIISPSLEYISNAIEPLTWRITVFKNSKVLLNFNKYVDGLILYDGYDETAPIMELEQSFSRKLSSSNIIYMVSQNKKLSYAFEIEWKSVSIRTKLDNKTCSYNLILPLDVDNVFNVTSSNYPNPLRTCIWVLKSKSYATHVELALYGVSSETKKNCYFHYLKIYSNNNLNEKLEIDRFCNMPYRKTPIKIMKGNPHLELKFYNTLDKSASFTGLAKTVCGSHMIEPNGIIHEADTLSKGFDDTEICEWTIEVRSTRTIKFYIEFYEKYVDCSAGSFSIYDGLNADAPKILNNVCARHGILDESKIKTTSNLAYIQYNGNKINWTIRYQEYMECNNEIRLEKEFYSTKINTPNYPNTTMTDCRWILTAPKGNMIDLIFLENFGSSTSKEFIEIRDGSSDLAPLKEIFNEKSKNTRIKSSSNFLFIQYKASSEKPGKGFNATVYISKCGGIYNDPRGTIISENYPTLGGYSPNCECKYHIKVSDKYHLEFTIEDFDLPFNIITENENDYLEMHVVDLNFEQNLEKRIYGNNTEKHFYVYSSEILFKFITFKKNFKHRGFKISYNRIFDEQCNQVSYDKPLGEFLFKGNDLLNEGLMICHWEIVVPKGHIVTARLIELEFSTTTFLVIQFANDDDFVSVIRSDKFITNSFMENNMDLIESTDNRMHIHFFKNVETKLKRIRISFTSIKITSCPKLDKASGSLIIPNELLSKNFYCEIDLKNYMTTFVFYVRELKVSTSTFGEKPIQFLIDNSVETRINPLLFQYFNGNYTNEVAALPFRESILKLRQTDSTKLLEIRIDYKTHKCGGVINKINENFEIDSNSLFKNFTQSYGEIDCSWWFELSSQLIKIKGIIHFMKNCSEEYLTVYNGAYLNAGNFAPGRKKYCSTIKTGETVEFNFTMNYKYSYIHYHSNAANINSTFSLTSQEYHRCGGMMYLNSRIEFNANDYKNKIYCIWNYKTKATGFYVKIMFIKNFFIEYSPNCTKDYLIIRQKILNQWIEGSRLCGRTIPFKSNETQATEIQIIFRTDDSITSEGFHLLLSDHCNLKINVTDKEIHSIRIPNMASNSEAIKCNYHFNSSSVNDLVELSLRTFYKIDLDQTKLLFLAKKVDTNKMELDDFDDDSSFCKMTNLTIYKARANKLIEVDSLCQSTGLKTKSETSKIFNGEKYFLIKFSGNTLNPNLNYISYGLDKCGGEIKKSKTLVSTPMENAGNENDSFTYSKNLFCIWNITAPQNTEILIKFNFLELGYQFLCNDYVGIYKGNNNVSENNEILKLCGNHTKTEPLIVKIPNFTGMIIMKSDGHRFKNDERGFEAVVDFITKCDEIFEINNDNQLIITKKYDEVNLDCHIFFKTSDPKYQLKLNIEDVTIPNCSSVLANSKHSASDVLLQTNPCDCYYLEIYDSKNIFRNKIGGKFCNLKLPPAEFQSTDEHLLLRIVTNDVLNFSINISISIQRVLSICGEKYINIEKDTNTILQSPNFDSGSYPPNTKCSWIIYANYFYFIHFEKFDIDGDDKKCNDFIQISQMTSTFKDTLCGDKLPPDIRIKAPTKLDYFANIDGKTITKIDFYSDSSVQKAGFKLVIKKDLYCNETFTTLSGRIEHITKNQTCKFNFEVPAHYMISFYFSEYPSICHYWSTNIKKLKFYDGDSRELLKESSYASFNNYAFFFKTNKIILETENTKPNNINCFEMFYVASDKGVGCGGRLSDKLGYFTSPLHPENYRNYTSCKWTIELSPIIPITVQFITFDLGPKQLCEYNNLQIYEMGGSQQFYCGNDHPATFKSLGVGQVLIEYKRTADFDGTGWSLVYTSGFSRNQTFYTIVND